MTVDRPSRPRVARRNRSTAFSANRRGTAAIELAVLLPFITAALIAMVDIGNAVYMKYDVERRMRHAIEGIERYGIDQESVVAFANVDGNTAFAGQNDVAANPASLTVTMAYLCRADDLTATTHASLDDVACANYETWYTISATRSYTGLFGKTFDLTTSVDVMVD